MLACLIVVAVLMKVQGGGGSAAGSGVEAAATTAFICLYVAGFAWSWGPLAWLLPSEIATEETRSAGLAVATFTNFA